MVKVELVKDELGGFKIYPMCIDCESESVHQAEYDGSSKEQCPFTPIDGVCPASVDIKIIGNTENSPLEF